MEVGVVVAQLGTGGSTCVHDMYTGKFMNTQTEINSYFFLKIKLKDPKQVLTVRTTCTTTCSSYYYSTTTTT